MHRFRRNRSLRTVGVVAILAACLAAATANSASADPVDSLDQAKAQLRKVQRQVRRLDHRAEQLTEDYDRATWELSILHRQILDARRRLRQTEAQLASHQQSLSELMIARYKGLDPETLEILLGAQSLSSITGGLDLQSRLDQAMASAVTQIQQLRDDIEQQQVDLAAAQRRAQHEAAAAVAARKLIRRQLRHRRELMSLLGSQIDAAEAALSIGQQKLALHAAGWITADMRHNRRDAGAMMRDQVALEALKQIGVPYKWGGASPEGGFDCSGLVMWLWAQHGVTLPHFAAAQYALGPYVASQDDLKIGDLVFFHHLGHVAIYIGNGFVVHAPHTGDVVRIAPLSMGWFQDTYVGATRPGPA
jgi:cell wall-associated NlpC family hydrolase